MGERFLRAKLTHTDGFKVKLIFLFFRGTSGLFFWRLSIIDSHNNIKVVKGKLPLPDFSEERKWLHLTF